MLRNVNLISGSGTTNMEVLKAEQKGRVLDGLVQTVAIVSSDPNAAGIKKALDLGFAQEHIHVIDPKKKDWGEALVAILDRYKADYFHQLGWMPFTPESVISRFNGLNQHLGPGGKWMYGVRRVYAHQRFCEMVGEQRPIPVFIQMVGNEYDSGKIVYMEWVDLLADEKPEDAQKRLFPIEYRVQIEGLRRLATNSYHLKPVPKIAKNRKEEELLFQARKEARDKYPSDTSKSDLFHPK